MWTIFKVFIEFVTILLLFYVLGHEACGILAPQPGIEPAPPAQEGKVLTTGPPGKSQVVTFEIRRIVFNSFPPFIGCITLEMFT